MALSVAGISKEVKVSAFLAHWFFIWQLLKHSALVASRVPRRALLACDCSVYAAWSVDVSQWGGSVTGTGGVRERFSITVSRGRVLIYLCSWRQMSDWMDVIGRWSTLESTVSRSSLEW